MDYSNDYYEINNIPLVYDLDTLKYVKMPTLTIMEYLKLNGFKNEIVNEGLPKEQFIPKTIEKLERIKKMNKKILYAINAQCEYKEN